MFQMGSVTRRARVPVERGPIDHRGSVGIESVEQRPAEQDPVGIAADANRARALGEILPFMLSPGQGRRRRTHEIDSWRRRFPRAPAAAGGESQKSAKPPSLAVPWRHARTISGAVSASNSSRYRYPGADPG